MLVLYIVISIVLAAAAAAAYRWYYRPRKALLDLNDLYVDGPIEL